MLTKLLIYIVEGEKHKNFACLLSVKNSANTNWNDLEITRFGRGCAFLKGYLLTLKNVLIIKTLHGNMMIKMNISASLERPSSDMFLFLLTYI